MLEWINDIQGMHEVASKHGHVGNHMLALIHWFMLILFVGWSAFLGIVLYKFRAKKNPKASYEGITSHFSTHIEVGVVIVEIVLLLGFAFPLWAKRADIQARPTGEDVVNLRAVGEQYRWTFHYAGADRMVGMTAYDRVSGGNPVGLVEEDPNSADDFITVNELVIPKDRPVVIQVTSKDVIHGLAIVPMFSQQDAIPGSEIPMWFVPQKEGEWNVVCAQLCGAGHAQMVAYVKCVSTEEFDEWYASQTPLLPREGEAQPATPDPGQSVPVNEQPPGQAGVPQPAARQGTATPATQPAPDAQSDPAAQPAPEAPEPAPEPEPEPEN